MKIALLGYGKMGKAIEEIAIKRNHTVILKANANDDLSALKDVDVAIEFSVPQAAIDNIKKCFAVNVPIVVGTTGWYMHFEDIKSQCISKNQSLFYASNFSVGVNIFFELNKRLAALMNHQIDYNVEMTEIHHIHKLDSPSGTAITLAEGLTAELERKNGWDENTNDTNKLNIIAKREGEVPGTHIINYENDIDSITIKHEAKGRIGFATGAVLAAEYIAKKKGVYTMKDLLNL